MRADSKPSFLNHITIVDLLEGAGAGNTKYLQACNIASAVSESSTPTQPDRGKGLVVNTMIEFDRRREPARPRITAGYGEAPSVIDAIHFTGNLNYHAFVIAELITKKFAIIMAPVRADSIESKTP